MISTFYKEVSSIRITQVFESGTWRDISFNELESGDVFRQFQEGDAVKDEDGGLSFTATSDAYLNDDDIWQVGISS